MSRRAATQASQMASRAIRSSSIVARSPLASRFAPAVSRALLPRTAAVGSLRSFFSTIAAREKGIMPDSENPVKSEPEADSAKFAVVELDDSTYHELADEYLDNVVAVFEEIQDARGDIDVEFSSGVLTLAWPDNGTYVINKQPPNKQIWLSSPISGPKRFDWCIAGDGQGDKEGTAEGNWVYTRDGTTLSEVFLEELGIDIDDPSGQF